LLNEIISSFLKNLAPGKLNKMFIKFGGRVFEKIGLLIFYIFNRDEKPI